VYLKEQGENQEVILQWQFEVENKRGFESDFKPPAA
jgi:hypothetical protein